jgi:hypothetical protein
MVEPATLNARIIVGDTLRLPLTLEDEATGDPIDLSAETFTALLYDRPGGELWATGEVEPTDLPAGQIDVVFSDTITAGLADKDGCTGFLRIRNTAVEPVTWAEGNVRIGL